MTITSETPGFLLTRHWRDTTRGVQLELWFATAHGPVRVVIDGQESVFFVKVDDAERIKSSRGFDFLRVGEARFKNRSAQNLVAVYCRSYAQVRECRDRLRSQGIEMWESDVRPPERFLMERFVTASVFIKGQTQDLGSHRQFRNPQLQTYEYRPAFKVVSLDIETSMDGSELYSIAVFTESERRVFMVGGKDTTVDDVQIVGSATSKQCLEDFFHWFKQFDPDVIIGWNVVQFDLSVLEKLCQQQDVAYEFARAGAQCHWREDGDDSGRRYINIPGRVALDGIEVLKAATYNFPSYALENVAQRLLGQGKLLNAEDRGREISDLFYHDKVQLALYNLKDCQLVWDIFQHSKLIEFAIERSLLTGLLLDRIGGSVAAFEYAYLPHLHRKGYIAPNLGEVKSDVASPGGYVMDSEPGIFHNVLVLDFKSLYPSIIRTFKIDPYGCWFAEHQRLDDEETVAGFHGIRFAKNEHLLPRLIENLWAARDRAKAEKNGPLSQAIKIIMNSFYGVLGTPGCRFFDPRICSSITRRGHQIIQQSRQWIEQMDHKVIYGDTDSLFVWVGDDCTEDEALTIGRELAQTLNGQWIEHLAEEFAIDSALEIEFETHYLQFLMPTVRGSSVGSKKRYAGTVREGDAVKLVFKGLENVRTDWTDLAKEFQEELYLRVFRNKPVESYVYEVSRQVRDGERDSDLIYRKRLRRKLSDYQKGSPPHVQAARKLQQQLQQDGPSKVAKGEWISYVITVNGPEPENCRHSPIDYQHYIDKQLQPVADGVLQFVGLNFSDIVAPQLTLFSEM